MALKPWILKSNPLINNLRDVVYDGSQYVAVGTAITSPPGLYTLTSPQGGTWTQENNPFSKGGSSHIAAGDGILCLIQPLGITGGFSTVSTDGGKTWTGNETGIPGMPEDMIRAGGRFIGVGLSVGLPTGTINSLDGKTGWVRVNTPINSVLNAVAANADGSVVIAIGNNVLVDNGPYIVRSTDQGQSWTRIFSNVGGAINMYGICHTGTRFVGVGAGGQIMRSFDGLSWSKQFAPINTTILRRIDGNDDLLVAAGDDQGGGKGPLIIFSEDGGAAWKQAPDLGISVSLRGVAVNGLNVVVVGLSNGVQGTIGFSGTIIPLIQRSNLPLSKLTDRIRRRLLTELGSFVYNPALGSNLHILTRAKNIHEVYALAEIEVRSALRPEIQKGHILDIGQIRVKEKTLNTVSLEIDILVNNRERLTIPILIS